MTFLLGRHAMFGQDPPTYFRSTTATRCPCSAKVQASSFEPAPLPRMRRSYSSGWPCRSICAVLLCISQAIVLGEDRLFTEVTDQVRRNPERYDVLEKEQTYETHV